MRQPQRVSLLICILMYGSLLTVATASDKGGLLPQTNNASVNVILDEEFLAASGSTPPPGWTCRILSGGVADVWRFDNNNSRSLLAPMSAPAAMVDYVNPGERDVVLESPEFNAQASQDIVLSFYHRLVLTDSFVTVKVDVFDGFSWHQVFTLTQTTPGVRAESFSISGSSNCSPRARIRFRWTGSGIGYWIVDNVMLIQRVTTARPAEVSVVSPADGATNVTARASLGWTPSSPCPSGYRVYLGTNNPPTNILNGVDVGSSTSYVHPTSFQYNTTYYWKVVPYNQNGNAANVAVKSFSVGSNPTVTTFPYSQNFDGSTYGWSSENANGDAYTWDLTTQHARSNPYATIAYAPVNSNLSANDWLFSVPLRTTAGHQYKVDFWMRAAKASKPEALELTFGRDQISLCMNPAPVFRNSAITDTTYRLVSAFFTSPDSVGTSDVYVGWHHISQSGSEFLLVDDVTITDIGAAPIVLSNFSALRNGSSVALTWRALSQTNNQQFEIQRAVAPSLDFQTLPGSVVTGHGTTGTAHDYSWNDNAPGTSRVYYRIKQVCVGGAIYYSNPIQLDGLTGVSSSSLQPEMFVLGQNYPNPFNPETKIEFSVNRSSSATLTVYNMLGQAVATLFDGVAQSDQTYISTFNGSQLPSGVYFYRLQSGSASATRKLMLLK